MNTAYLLPGRNHTSSSKFSAPLPLSLPKPKLDVTRPRFIFLDGTDSVDEDQSVASITREIKDVEEVSPSENYLDRIIETLTFI